jgi:hypothetical protein
MFFAMFFAMSRALATALVRMPHHAIRPSGAKHPFGSRGRASLAAMAVPLKGQHLGRHDVPDFAGRLRPGKRQGAKNET